MFTILQSSLKLSTEYRFTRDPIITARHFGAAFSSEIDLQEVEFGRGGGMDEINMAQDRERWLDVANAVMKIALHKIR